MTRDSFIRSGCAPYAKSRELVAILAASGIVISGWALFPSTVETGTYVPLPVASAPSASVIRHADLDVADRVAPSAGAPLGLAGPTAPSSTAPIRIRYASATVDVAQIPVRAKLQALLSMLYSQSGEFDPAELEAKIEALLKLPDDVLAQLMAHPDLEALNTVLDAVFRGTSQVRDVKAELDKIDVTSVPGPAEEVRVVKVSGKTAYTVRTSTAEPRTTTESVAVARESMVPAVTLASPSDEQTAVAPPPPPPPAPMMRTMALAVVPDAALPPAAAAPSAVDAPPASTPPSSPEPTHPPAPSADPPPTTAGDVMSSGNKFEPGETVADHGSAGSTATGSSTAPSTAQPTAAAPPAQPDGAGGAGGGTATGADTGAGGASSAGGGAE
jgi:hypothetical protein